MPGEMPPPLTWSVSSLSRHHALNVSFRRTLKGNTLYGTGITVTDSSPAADKTNGPLSWRHDALDDRPRTFHGCRECGDEDRRKDDRSGRATQSPDGSAGSRRSL